MKLKKESGQGGKMKLTLSEKRKTDRSNESEKKLSSNEKVKNKNTLGVKFS